MASGLNHLGQVVGHCGPHSPCGGILWDGTDVTPLDENFTPADINDAGEIAGMYGDPCYGTAVLMTSTGFTPLPLLPYGSGA